MRAADWAFFAVCGLLLLAGPSMALQEWMRFEDQRALQKVTGEIPELEPAFRATWRGWLLLFVIAAGVLGTMMALRVARQQKVRAVSGRLMLLLLSGMVLLDLAFLADGRWFMDVPYAIRGATIVWLYPAAAVLMGGAALRLVEIEDVFGDARAP